MASELEDMCALSTTCAHKNPQKNASEPKLVRCVMRPRALLWNVLCAVYVSCIWCAVCVGESVCATSHLLHVIPCRVLRGTQHPLYAHQKETRNAFACQAFQRDEWRATKNKFDRGFLNCWPHHRGNPKRAVWCIRDPLRCELWMTHKFVPVITQNPVGVSTANSQCPDNKKTVLRTCTWEILLEKTVCRCMM